MDMSVPHTERKCLSNFLNNSVLNMETDGLLIP